MVVSIGDARYVRPDAAAVTSSAEKASTWQTRLGGVKVRRSGRVQGP